MPTIYQDIQYVVRIDEVSSTLYYVGYSFPGTSESDPVWTIIKIETIGTVTKQTCPNGSLESDFIWTNRTSYTYL